MRINKKEIRIIGTADIHTHILYGVDDGASDIEDSIKLLTEEWEQGVRKVVLTPHYGPKFGHPKPEILQSRFHEICTEAGKSFPELQLFLGSELYYQNTTIDDLKAGKALTMNGTRYVLVEFGVGDSFSRIEGAVQDLIYAGYIPIIAHVERYKAVFGELDLLERLIKIGAYLQVNSNSITGNLFDKRTKFCKQLIKNDMLHFIASDCHDTKKRLPNINEGAAVVCKMNDRILFDNPNQMLKGKYM